MNYEKYCTLARRGKKCDNCLSDCYDSSVDNYIDEVDNVQSSPEDFMEAK